MQQVSFSLGVPTYLLEAILRLTQLVCNTLRCCNDDDDDYDDNTDGGGGDGDNGPRVPKVVPHGANRPLFRPIGLNGPRIVWHFSSLTSGCLRPHHRTRTRAEPVYVVSGC